MNRPPLPGDSSAISLDDDAPIPSPSPHPGLSHPTSPPASSSPSPSSPLSQYVTLISSDGFDFLVHRSVCLFSGTIRAMLSGNAQWAEHSSGPVPTIRFDDISRDVLEKIIQYFYYKAKWDNQTPPIPEFPMDTKIIVKLLLAANFLDV